MTPDSRVFLAGHEGLVGSAVLRRLEAGGYSDVLRRDRAALDLTDQASVRQFFEAEQPEVVILAAARVGGIGANDRYRAEFIRDNLLIQTHVLDAAHRTGVRRALFLGSSCVYPKNCPQPIQEGYLLTGLLEETNEAYATAKIAGIKMCEAFNRQYETQFLPVMPTNLYGPKDNFDPETSHVLAAFIRRFHEAKIRKRSSVRIWGSGAPKREFLHVDDLADACVFLLERTSRTRLINIGFGAEITIMELARLVSGVVGYTGEIEADMSKPDGTPRKLLDSTELRKLGWKPAIPLREGVESTYRWYRSTLSGELPSPGGIENTL
jgi:GDP-L-fucose synthase